MRNIIVFLIVIFAGAGLKPSPADVFAATVGGQVDMGMPEASFLSKAMAVDDTLDAYESDLNMKASVAVEFVSKKKLRTASDDSKAKIEGQNVDLKISTNYMNAIEPYVKIGTSNIRVKWVQHDQSVEVDAKPGLVLGGGVKTKLRDFPTTGIRLTLDGQYKDTHLDFDSAKIAGSSTTASATSETFEIREWQVSLLASKKFIFPMGMQDCYTVPYMGLTYSDSEVNVEFTQSSSGGLYSTYHASNKNPIGLVLGCDIIPSLLSWYLFSFELRLINETAFTLSGTMKF